MKQYTDCMIDFETLSVASNAAVISLGAVLFNVNKGIEDRKEFKLNIDMQEILNSPKFDVSASTLSWWIGQNRNAWNAATMGPQPLGKVLLDFSDWLFGNCKHKEIGGEVKADVRLWSNGAGSDIPWLRNAYEAKSQKTPWLFWNERCYRTIKAMSSVQMQRANDHDALSDARNQAHHLCEIFATEGFEIW